MMSVNDPAVLAEITALFARYEQALGGNDINALNAMFWPSDLALRYGAGENLYGFAAISGFRAARAGGSPPRTLRNTVITTFGRDLATTNTEFLRVGTERIGRQSQTWVRMTEGWRIVAAHVSFMAATS